MRRNLMTTNQSTAQGKGCRMCNGSGVVKQAGKTVSCIKCSGKGTGYATKSTGGSNGLARSC